MKQGLLFASGLLLILMLGYGFFYSKKSGKSYNKPHNIQADQRNASSEKIIVSWIEQYTINDAYKNGFGWLVEFVGFGTIAENKKTTNNFAYIKNRSTIAMSIISDQNIKFNYLTDPFWKWENQKIRSQKNWDYIFKGVFLPLAIDVQSIWVDLLERNYQHDLYLLSMEDFSKKYANDSVLIEGFGAFSRSNWILSASRVAVNISGQNELDLYSYMINISENYLVSIASDSANQNLIALVEAYNTSYYRIDLSIMQYMQYAYNIHVLGIMMYYADPHVYQAVQNYLGRAILPESGGNYETSIQKLNTFFKNNYIVKFKDLMRKFPTPKSSEKILRNQHGLKLSSSFINNCKLVGFYEITAKGEFLIEGACTGPPPGEWSSKCEDATYLNGISSANCKDDDNNKVTSALHYIKNCQPESSVLISKAGKLACSHPYSKANSLRIITEALYTQNVDNVDLRYLS